MISETSEIIGTVKEEGYSETGISEISGTINLEELDIGETLTWSVVSGVSDYGTFSINQEGIWTYTLDNSLTKTDLLTATDSLVEEFVIRVEDSLSAFSEETVKITITGTNDAPILSSDQGSITENEILTLDVLSNDSDVDSTTLTLSYVAIENDNGSMGTVSIVGNKLVFNPGSDFDYLAAGDTTEIVVNYIANDEHGAEATSSATITITGTNDTPTLGSAIVELTESDSVLTTSGTLSISDADNGESVYEAQTNTVGTYGTFTIDANGEWTFTANSALDELTEGQEVNDVFIVKSADGTQTSVTVTITGTNDTPELGSAIVELTESDSVLSTSGQLSISDADEGEAVYVAQTNTAGNYGKFSIDENGNWDFIANNALDELTEGQEVSDVFTVESADGTQTNVTVNITGTNDAPIIEAQVNEVLEDSQILNGQLTASDLDLGSVLTYSSTSTLSAFTLNADGSYTFDASEYDYLPQDESEEVVLNITVTDWRGNINSYKEF